MGSWSFFLVVFVVIGGFHYWSRATRRKGPEWADLAHMFPDRRARSHLTIPLSSASIATQGYASCLKFELCDDHLRVAGVGPFAYALGDPIAIPLDRLSFRSRKGHFIRPSHVDVLIEGVPEARITIPSRTANRLVQSSAGRLKPFEKERISPRTPSQDLGIKTWWS